MTPDVLIAVCIAAFPGVLACGGFIVKIGRLERDIGQCITREAMKLEMELVRAELRHLSDTFERSREESGVTKRMRP